MVAQLLLDFPTKCNTTTIEAKVGALKHMLSMKVWVLDFDDGIVVAFHFRHVGMAKAAAKC